MGKTLCWGLMVGLLVIAVTGCSSTKKYKGQDPPPPTTYYQQPAIGSPAPTTVPGYNGSTITPTPVQPGASYVPNTTVPGGSLGSPMH